MIPGTSYWFQHASIIFTYSKSASFVALVSAIEVILPEQEAAQNVPSAIATSVQALPSGSSNLWNHRFLDRGYQKKTGDVFTGRARLSLTEENC